MFIYVYTYKYCSWVQGTDGGWTCRCIQIYVFEIGAHAYKINAKLCM